MICCKLKRLYGFIRVESIINLLSSQSDHLMLNTEQGFPDLKIQNGQEQYKSLWSQISPVIDSVRRDIFNKFALADNPHKVEKRKVPGEKVLSQANILSFLSVKYRKVEK